MTKAASSRLMTSIACSRSPQVLVRPAPWAALFIDTPYGLSTVVHVQARKMRERCTRSMRRPAPSNGRLRWRNSDNSSPAVQTPAAYTSPPAAWTRSVSGQPVWHHTTGCEGGGGSTAVIADHSLYARGDGPPPIKVLGRQKRTITSQTALAFDSDAAGGVTGPRTSAARGGGPSAPRELLVTAPVVSGSAVCSRGAATGWVCTGAQV